MAVLISLLNITRMAAPPLAVWAAGGGLGGLSHLGPDQIEEAKIQVAL